MLSTIFCVLLSICFIIGIVSMFLPRKEDDKTYCALIPGCKLVKKGEPYFGKFRQVFGRAVEDVETYAQDWECIKCKDTHRRLAENK